MFSRFPVSSLLAVLVTASPLLAQNPGTTGRGDRGVVPPQEQNPNLPSRIPLSSFDEATAGEYYAAAQEYDNSGSPAQAIAAYKSFIKQYPASKLASKAQFRIAELYEAQNNLTRAFEAYQTLVTRYPDTPEFEKAVSAQVVIANKYMAEERIRILGFSLNPGYERAQGMYEKIIKNAPYSKHAPVAQFNLGLSFERQKKAREAILAYQTAIDKYPDSTIADDALYQIAYVNMRVGLNKNSQDLSSLVLAKEGFEDFLLQYPNSEKAAQAKDNLATIGARESGDLLAIAKYYDWSRNYRAARTYYSAVIKRQPNTEDAKLASTRVQELDNSYGADVQPVTTADSGQTTALRRRLEAQVQSSALADYNGPSRSDIVPDELPVARPRMRTDIRDAQPMPAPVEPLLPTQ